MLLPQQLFTVAAIFHQFRLLFAENLDLKILFWIDSDQSDEIVDDITLALNDIRLQNESFVNIADYILELKSSEWAESGHDDEVSTLKRFCDILRDMGVSLVLDFSLYSWQLGLDIVGQKGIPYIKTAIQMKPFLHVFGEYLKERQGNDVVLVLQNEYDAKETLLQLIEGYPFRVLILNGRNRAETVKRIRNLRPLPSYYGIFANTDQMNAIFEEILNNGLFQRPSEWHFIYLDGGDERFTFKDNIVNSTVFQINAKELCESLRRPIQQSYCKSELNLRRAFLMDLFLHLSDLRRSKDGGWLNVIYDDNCDDKKKRLLNISALNASDHSSGHSTNIKILEYLENSSDFLKLYSMNSMIAYNDNYDDVGTPLLSYQLNISISIYNSGMGNNNNNNKSMAIWQNNKLRKINETISPSKRFFRIGTAEALPWSYYLRNPDTGEILLNANGKELWEGYCIDLIAELSTRMNFDYEILPPSKGKFGNRNPVTGKWDGLVGDLVSGEIDFAVAALKMYSEREEVIDFVAPYFEQTGISILMRNPVKEKSLFKFLTVLRVEVWLCILAALVATSIMIWLMDKYSPYSARNNKEAYPYPCREFTLRESFWFALTSFTPQGGGEAPKAVSGRILVAAYWLFVVLMLATFTANLAAFLTVERMQAPVQSLEQLARQSRINYTVVEGSDTHQYFINMKFAEDTLYRMWKELSLNASRDFHKYRVWDYPIKEQYGHILLSINSSNPVRDAEEGFRKVNAYEDADFAFIHDSSEIKYAVTRNCNFTEVGEVFAEQPYSIAIQQGSFLQDELTYNLLILQKSRYFENLKAKYWNRTKANCPATEDQEGISLDSLGGVFIAAVFGLLLAIIILIIEVLYHSRKKRKDNQVANAEMIEVKPVTTETTVHKISSLWPKKPPKKQRATYSPPPTFEIATVRDKVVPKEITIGGRQFQPRRTIHHTRGGLHLRRQLQQSEEYDETLPPPYLE